jgi:hypothetical protein
MQSTTAGKESRTSLASEGHDGGRAAAHRAFVRTAGVGANCS